MRESDNDGEAKVEVEEKSIKVLRVKTKRLEIFLFISPVSPMMMYLNR